MKVKSEKGDLRDQIVSGMLKSLGIKIDDKEIQNTLKSIRMNVMLIIQQYCKDKKVDPEKTSFVIREILENPNTLKENQNDTALIWACLPITEYIQQTVESQWFVQSRLGGNKSLKLVILNALITELGNLDNLDIRYKIKIAKAFLIKVSSDEVWKYGENGKRAIDESLSNLSHIESVHKNQQEVFILRVACYISCIISSYRASVNEQIDWVYMFSWGYSKRQGTINLEHFDKFLKNVHQIAKNSDNKPFSRIKQMMAELTNFRQKIKGQKSAIAWQDIYSRLSEISQRFEIAFSNDDSISTETQNSSRSITPILC